MSSERNKASGVLTSAGNNLVEVLLGAFFIQSFLSCFTLWSFTGDLWKYTVQSLYNTPFFNTDLDITLSGCSS